VFLSLCSALSKEQGITIAAVCVMYEFFIAHKVSEGEEGGWWGKVTKDGVTRST
jgi:hypothetical protein